jgi:hypothetical protein
MDSKIISGIKKLSFLAMAITLVASSAFGQKKQAEKTPVKQAAPSVDIHAY